MVKGEIPTITSPLSSASSTQSILPSQKRATHEVLNSSIYSLTQKKIKEERKGVIPWLLLLASFITYPKEKEKRRDSGTKYIPQSTIYNWVRKNHRDIFSRTQDYRVP